MTNTYEINHYGMVTYHGNGNDIAYFRPHIANRLFQGNIKMRHVAKDVSGSPCILGFNNGLYWGSSTSNGKLVKEPADFDTTNGLPTVGNFSTTTSQPSYIMYFTNTVTWLGKYLTVTTSGSLSGSSWVNAVTEISAGSVLPDTGNVFTTEPSAATKTKAAQHVALVESSGSVYPGYTTLASGGKTWVVASGTFPQSFSGSGAIAKTGTDTFKLYYATTSGGDLKTMTSTDGGVTYTSTPDATFTPSVKGVTIGPSNQNPAVASDGYRIVGATNLTNGDVILALAPASAFSATTPYGYQRDFSSLSRHPHPRGIYLMRSQDGGNTFSMYLFIPMNYGQVTRNNFCISTAFGNTNFIYLAYYDNYAPAGLDNSASPVLVNAKINVYIGSR